jgi:hypothetical protein
MEERGVWRGGGERGLDGTAKWRGVNTLFP